MTLFPLNGDFKTRALFSVRCFSITVYELRVFARPLRVSIAASTVYVCASIAYNLCMNLKYITHTCEIRFALANLFIQMWNVIRTYVELASANHWLLGKLKYSHEFA